MSLRPLLNQCCIAGFLASQAIAGPFQNLDFEAATVPSTPPNQFGPLVADPAQVFPGWAVGSQFTCYNNSTISSPAQVLIGPSFPNALGMLPMQGNYSAQLRYGPANPLPNLPTAFLRQTGMIPEDARSLTFLMDPIWNGGQILLDGIAIPIMPVAGPGIPGSSLHRFGVDVTDYAGREVELTLMAQPTNSLFYFDDLQFSAQVAPGPGGMWVLLAAATIRRRRR